MAAGTVVLGASGALALGAHPAQADTSSGSAAVSPGGTGQGGPNALGGFTLGAIGSGVSVFYEQPSFPVPASPTFEVNLGYTNATFDAGPTGESLASVFWPGQVAANGASQLGLLLGGYLAPAFGGNPPTMPNPGPWPVQADTKYPQGPTSQSNDNGTITMEASSSSSSSTATSAMGAVGGASAAPAGLVSAQSVGSSALSTVDNAGEAVAQATSSVHGVSIAGGLITVGQVTSTASSASDGSQATVKGTSTVAQVAVAGEAVTVDASGVHSSGTAPASAPVLGAVAPTVNQILSLAGVTMTVTNPTDTVTGPSGVRQLDGLQVVMDLTTFDQNLSTLVNMLPAPIVAGIRQLPLPLPDHQVVTVDLGWVNVSAAASPPYNADLGSAVLNSGGSGPVSSDLGSTGAELGSGGSYTTPGTPGTSGTPGSTGGPDSSGGGGPAALATAPVALFKGIGTGLIVLGLILGGLLTFVLLRADAAVGALAAAPPCVGEHVS
jgi:hypothetical protein